MLIPLRDCARVLMLIRLGLGRVNRLLASRLRDTRRCRYMRARMFGVLILIPVIGRRARLRCVVRLDLMGLSGRLRWRVFLRWLVVCGLKCRGVRQRFMLNVRMLMPLRMFGKRCNSVREKPRTGMRRGSHWYASANACVPAVRKAGGYGYVIKN